MAKHGRDQALEQLADKLLSEGVGANKRSLARDIEKMSYQSGHIPLAELQHYDPANDWDSQDEPWTLIVDDVTTITPSLCTADDGNVRARSREDPSLPPGVWGRAGEEERRKLLRHVADGDDWGSTRESIPLSASTTARARRAPGASNRRGRSTSRPRPIVKIAYIHGAKSAERPLCHSNGRTAGQ